MDVHELQNIMTEYGKIKSIKVIHHQNGVTENRAMICYETEKEAQRTITKINRYKGWTAEKYITNKATRTRNQFKERTNTSSREKETEENDREKINQSGIKDERTCYTCGTKEHKIKDCESKLNIFITFKENLSSEELKRIMEEYGIVKSIKIKEAQTGQKKQAMVCYSKEREAQEAITEIKGYEGWNAEVYRNFWYLRKRLI